MLKVVHDAVASNENGATGGSLIDQIVRDGARAMLATALQAEVAAYIDAHGGEVDENGFRLVVRNGFHQPREVVTAAGAVPVRAPRVNDKRFDAETGERRRFSSAILPAWARKSPQVAEVLPLLYLHGLSSSDFGPALEQFLGSAAGLSAATITRLTAQWQDDAEAFNKRSLKDTDYVYVWVDGIHLKVRLEADKVCLLFPDTREQRCWFHVSSNVLAALPKSAHPGGKAALAEIYSAEDRNHALNAVKAFEADYGAKWPKAVAKITEHTDVLLAFYDYPAQHWIQLRTTNPHRVDLRHRPASAAGHQGTRLAGRRSRDGVQAHRVRTSPLARRQRTHLVALVRAGARFQKGNSSNDPTNQEVISKSRDTPIHRS
jgi:putative transposase